MHAWTTLKDDTKVEDAITLRADGERREAGERRASQAGDRMKRSGAQAWRGRVAPTQPLSLSKAGAKGPHQANIARYGARH